MRSINNNNSLTYQNNLPLLIGVAITKAHLACTRGFQGLFNLTRVLWEEPSLHDRRGKSSSHSVLMNWLLVVSYVTVGLFLICFKMVSLYAWNFWHALHVAAGSDDSNPLFPDRPLVAGLTLAVCCSLPCMLAARQCQSGISRTNELGFVPLPKLLTVTAAPF